MAITNQSSLQSSYQLPDATTKIVNTPSNTTTTYNMTEEFSKVKSSSKTFAEPAETLTQTITLTNTSQFEISGVSVKDTISAGGEFVAGSVEIDGTAYPNYDIVTGFDLPSNIPATTGEVVITYSMKVSENVASDTVTNTATIGYTADDVTFEEDTNTVSIAVVNNKISVVKTASANVVQSGSTLSFTSVITNEGTIENTNLTFTDSIPEGTTFVAGSVTIDGTPYADYNPATGFALDDLVGGDSITVVFNVTVD